MSTLLQFDLKHILHPCSQMKDYEWLKPLIIEKAQGAYFYLSDGSKVIDAISSWWCKSFGHQHPRLKAALLSQLDQFEHVIFANTTNQVIVELTEALIKIMPHLSHVFYAGDGSCAVEIAMKMSLHVRYVRGETNRSRFIALSNGYHGETLGALSASDLSHFKKPYQSALLDVHFIHPLPYVTGKNDPLWNDCGTHWDDIEAKLLPLADSTTAILVEPILQGAGGMKIYSPDFLQKLAAFAKAHDIHLIADEIMTGILRTGKMLACEWANIEPDIVCLSKGLTSGWLPFSAVLFSEEINQHFYDDSPSHKSFLHSHTYSGNVLGAVLAREVLQMIQEENWLTKVNEMGEKMHMMMSEVAKETGKLQSVRQLGAMVAADFVETLYPAHHYLVFKEALRHGAFLRPLGSTIYWMPPFITEDHTLIELQEITKAAIAIL